MYRKIGVFLSSKDALPETHRRAAEDVGRLIGSTGRTLVYGGARKGLMEVLAQSVKRSGGRVFGMVPEIIERRNLVSDTLDVTFRCADLNDRKALMIQESDVLLALPGGIGTLDEVFTVMAQTVIGIGRKPVIFFNAGHCWDATLAALDDLFRQGLVSGQPADYYAVASTLDELQQLLD